MSTPILVARIPAAGGAPARDQVLLPALANRHGLVAGATGTGKTVTLQALAESFSRIGVPVFAADVKGDLSGIAAAGGGNERVAGRVRELGLSSEPGPGGGAWIPEAAPVAFWDIAGKLGHPVRTTVSDMGPLLFSRLLGLSEVQAGVLQIVFRVADDEGLLLLDLKDLRAMVQHVAENAATYRTEYGQVSAPSAAAIQRALLALEEAGGEALFGEPALDLDDLMRVDASGRGVVNLLVAESLIQSPAVYGTFLLWMLAELYETLPEVGDQEKPKLVFFFDEAHLLFDDAPEPLKDKIEQVVRLIRSKGVSIWFVTQNPLDIPETVLGQLGNRVQHALRAFTPRDQKAVKAAATTFRANPALDVAQVITELAVGEALVSFLDERGTPGVVERALIVPPRGRIGALDPAVRASMMASSPLAGRYDAAVDRESAYELLKARADAAEAEEREAEEREATEREAARRAPSRPRATRARRSTGEAMATSAARSIGHAVGREIVRGLMGSLFGGSPRRRRY